MPSAIRDRAAQRREAHGDHSPPGRRPAPSPGAPRLASAGNLAVQRLVQRAGPQAAEAQEYEADLEAERFAADEPGLQTGVSTASSEGGLLDSGLRPLFERHFGRELGAVRVHAGPMAAQSARGAAARAYTFGQDIVFGENQYRPATPQGLRLLTHELAHVVQQSRAEPRIQRQRDPEASAPEGPAAEHPLADYYFLHLALGAAVVQDMENAAIRREHLRGGQPFSGPAGSTSAEAPLTDFLPPTAAFVSRAEVLAQYIPLISASVGQSAAAGAFVREIARNEAARMFLEPFENAYVSVELLDPDGRTDTPSRLRFSVDGVEVRDLNGSVALTSLDVASPETLAEVTERAGVAAGQIAQVVEAQVRTEGALTKALPLANQIKDSPQRFALNDVKQLQKATLEFRRGLSELKSGLVSENRDQEAVVQGLIDQSAPVESAVNDALQAVQDLLNRTRPDLTAGELYSGHEREQEDYMAANWRAGGWGYGWMALNALEWGSTKLFHGAGTLLTAGMMDLEARNAWLYRTGQISYEAYSDNIWWNLGKSLVVAAVMALTAGFGGEFAVGALGLSEATGTLAYATTYGIGEGVVAGFSTSVAADAYSLLASNVSSVPGVQATQAAQVGGPEAWLESTAWGGALGGGISWGAFRMTTPGPMVFARETPLGGIQTIEGEFLGGLPFEPSSVLAEPRVVSPAERFLAAGEPRISPIWETPTRRFGELEYLESGGFAPPPVLYTEVGGQIAPIRAPAPEVTVLPSGEIVLGRPATPATELLGPAGQRLPRSGEILPETVLYSPGNEAALTIPARRYIDPETAPAVAGNPRLAGAGGNWVIVSSTTGGRMRACYALEEQMGAAFGRMYGGGGKTRYTLPTTEQFSGRTAPQEGIETDFTSLGRDVYGEAKVRDWTHPTFGEANALDLAGSIQRMYRAAGIDAQFFPAASTADFYVVSSRPIPAATHRTVVWELVTWMRGQGIRPNAIYDFLGRLKFMEMRLK